MVFGTVMDQAEKLNRRRKLLKSQQSVLRINILYVEQPLSNFGLKRKDLGLNQSTRLKYNLLIFPEGGRKDNFSKISRLK